MARYHIDKNGKPAICRATVKACPRGGADGTQNHFDTVEEAQRFADEQNEKEFGLVSKVKQPLTEEQAVIEIQKEMNNYPMDFNSNTPFSEQLKQQGFEIQDKEIASQLEKLDGINGTLNEAFAKAEGEGGTESLIQLNNARVKIGQAVAASVVKLKHDESGYVLTERTRKPQMTNEQALQATEQVKNDHPIMLDGKTPIVEQLKNQGIEITDPETISDFNELDRLNKETSENLKNETIDFQQAYQINEGTRIAIASRVAKLKHNESGYNKVKAKSNYKKPMNEQEIAVAIEREKRAYQVTFDGTPVVDQLKNQGLKITDEKTIGDLRELDKATVELKQLYQTRQISEEQYHQFQDVSKSIVAANIATLKHNEDGFVQM